MMKGFVVQEQQRVAVGPGNGHFISIARLPLLPLLMVLLYMES